MTTPESSRDTAKLYEVYDFLRAETPQLDVPINGVVFGRCDPLVGERAAQVALEGQVGALVITGGVGKDTGPLLNRGYKSEAGYLQTVFNHEIAGRLKLPVFLDENAINGTENAVNSVKIFAENGLNTNHLLAIAHATSLRRLAETLRKEAQEHSKPNPVTIGRRASNYTFDSTNPLDEKEALLEGLRLLDWPKSGALPTPLEQMDDNLEDFVRGRSDALGLKTPIVASPLKSRLLHMIPRNLRPAVLQRLV